MKDILINQIIPDVLYLILTTIFGLITYYVKQYLNSQSSMIEVQKQQMIEKIGVERYENDVKIAKQIILAVEQMGREFKWESEIKHTKAVEMISERTGLGTNDIYNIIKATVAEFNKDRDNTLKTMQSNNEMINK
ncbi:hypothetical protein HMPREF1982_04707 [Clostridiales bacterium oral taxon 876 str. F0540]|nr:hypothetical protein HMPREF1982_04707 [Clostridiales bacterium oral taxon 876 str. F0540]